MSDQRCEICRFAGRRSGFESYPCQRHAPITAHDPGKNMGVYPEAFPPRWPLMRGGDWCGDFESKPQLTIDGGVTWLQPGTREYEEYERERR